MQAAIYENMETSWSFPGFQGDEPPTWSELDEGYQWVRDLKDTPQDPVYHAEGDVWIHTRMVLEELTDMPEWRALSEPWKSITFAGCLMHDIAKPRFTKTEDGRITSRGHSGGGERMVRRLFWNGELGPAPLAVRESIAGLVRLHGLPMYLLERADPRRELFRAAGRARCDILSLVAMADMRGRTCVDQPALLETVELFREYAREQGCLDKPYGFASDHARFSYFRAEDRDPSYAAFDDTEFRVIMMCGLPGSGKDHWIKSHAPDLPMLSLDDVRAEMGAASAGNQGPVAREARERAREYLRKNQSFVWNATNLTRRIREPLTDLFVSYGARVELIYLEADRATLLERQKTRAKTADRTGEKDRAVPAQVLDKMMHMLDFPEPWEATTVNYLDTSE